MGKAALSKRHGVRLQDRTGSAAMKMKAKSSLRLGRVGAALSSKFACLLARCNDVGLLTQQAIGYRSTL
jgi:hypothetical protein